MYEELVKRLRERAAWINFPHHGEEYPTKDAKLMMDAADAIEELICEVADEHNMRLDAELKNQWIPVTERLPGEGMRVLCACRANIFCVLKWDGIDWVENPTHVYMRGFVTHWMPLPEPPKEET